MNRQCEGYPVFDTWQGHKILSPKSSDWPRCPPSLLFNGYPCLCPWRWSSHGVKLTTLLHLEPRLGMSRTVCPLPIYCISSQHIQGQLYTFISLFSMNVLSYLFTFQKTTSITSWIQDPCRSFDNLTLHFYFTHRMGLHVLVT